MSWAQIFVKNVDDREFPVPPVRISRLEDFTERFGALPVAPPPSGVPIQNENGEFEIRCLIGEMVSFVEAYIRSQGLVVTRVVMNDVPAIHLEIEDDE